MKKRVLLFLSATLCSLSFADATCPSAAMIKMIKRFDEVKVSERDFSRPGMSWEGSQRGQMYGTPFHWQFTLSGARGANKAQANANLIDALTTLQNAGPPIVNKTHVSCFYHSKLGVQSGFIIRYIKH